MSQIKVASTDEFNSSNAKCVEVGDKQLALFKVGGKFYCIDNTCTHRGGPLCEGELEGNIITCPWHGGQFDVTNGRVAGPPPANDVKSYPVLVKGKDIFVEV